VGLGPWVSEGLELGPPQSLIQWQSNFSLGIIKKLLSLKIENLQNFHIMTKFQSPF
jgi:hypothetical protein